MLSDPCGEATSEKDDGNRSIDKHTVWRLPHLEVNNACNGGSGHNSHQRDKPPLAVEQTAAGLLYERCRHQHKDDDGKDDEG